MYVTRPNVIAVAIIKGRSVRNDARGKRDTLSPNIIITNPSCGQVTKQFLKYFYFCKFIKSRFDHIPFEDAYSSISLKY